MSNGFEDAVSCAAAAFSAIAAGLALLTSRKANSTAEKANRTAEQANQTAARVAAIERDRQHGELRPQLTVNPRFLGAGDRYVLDLHWTGPDELEPRGPLTVTVTVRDDRPDRDGQVMAGGPTVEEIRRQIWGPWRLQPHVGGADADGRTSPARNVPVGEVLVSSIERTRAPHWSGPNGQESWEDQYRGKPLRLRIEVTVAGFEPWVFLREVSIM